MQAVVRGFFKQIVSLWKLLLGIYVPVLALFGAVAVGSKFIPHLNIPELLRDVSSLGKLPFYAGAISQLGLLFWSATTAVCFFTYFSLRKLPGARKEALNLTLFAGLLTGYMTLDDTFLLHDEFFSDYLKILPERAVIFALGLAMLAFLFFNWKEIMRGDYSLMILAFALFGISVFFDAIPTEWYEDIYFVEKIEHIVEDGAKFAAIITWLTFYARYGYQQISALVIQNRN